ncbi:hypothetical protein WR25_04623 [Diploscapter pachys]|uniref:Nuclear receptor domain-containing protein n=1 Tax=Diploscapter pachys TaxID=2018661 RepID=A0A2A2JM94_9BILA|nr:hypothetical protein WR25_04623 [Diploscapter pachys]
MMSYVKREYSNACNDSASMPTSSVIVDYEEWQDQQPCSNRICTICGAPSNGYHFNAASCSACAAFFRRTVTLNRHFTCNQHNNCRVNYAMRVICRACRYQKCIAMGMQRNAVQPRRDCNVGRRKISYRTFSIVPSQPSAINSTSPIPAPVPVQFLPLVQTVQEPDRQPQPQPPSTAVESTSCDLSPDQLGGYAASYSSSISEDNQEAVQLQASPGTSVGESTLEWLLREERLFNERRRLLYCTKTSLSKLMASFDICDIPFSQEDVHELTFHGIQKTIRPHILLIYEWMRGWPYFEQLSAGSKLKWLRRCILYHVIVDPAYLTVRLGLEKGRFVMFNGMYAGIAEDSVEGWRDEDCIKAELKKSLYRPLLERVMKEIVLPMQTLKLNFQEYTALKALLSFRGAAMSIDFPTELRNLMNSYCDRILKALHHHYVQQGYEQSEVAERTGNLILLMSSIYAVSMECLESHQKIQIFDLWELDELLLKLISPRI